MKRLACVAMVVLGVVACLVLNESEAQESTADSNNQKIGGLLQERYDVLAQRFETVKQGHDSGRRQATDLIAARDDLLRAKLEISSSHQQRVEVCRERVENLRSGEEIAEIQSNSGTGTVEDRLLATAARIQAEVECLRLESLPH